MADNTTNSAVEAEETLTTYTTETNAGAGTGSGPICVSAAPSYVQRANYTSSPNEWTTGTQNGTNSGPCFGGRKAEGDKAAIIVGKIRCNRRRVRCDPLGIAPVSRCGGLLESCCNLLLFLCLTQALPVGGIGGR